MEGRGLTEERQKRKQLACIYNMRREDFANTPSYEDYCEMAEDVAYRWIRGDAEAEREKEAYLAANADAIRARNDRNALGERATRQQLVQAHREAEQARAAARAHELAVQAAYRREREAAQTRIQLGELSAADATARQDSRVAKRVKRQAEKQEQQLQMQQALMENGATRPDEPGWAAKDATFQPSTFGVGPALGRLPQPLGQVTLHAAGQAQIGNSYRGVLSADDLAKLLEKCRATHPGESLWRKREMFELYQKAQ